ncbi:SDR family NAD(P)-dependent oxidoreductase [Kibdelosporangium aridum]|uniref:3-oxoacyl-[acyl-carrier protein] reductase n=1 Tax=Kibdelosporangium aridum TaxID=2030 RepID=A0A1Y5XYP3_KIBAR|nr:SDR family oxidoreductase [Kibdelosporangium aridum]SMD20408.1 3-oxoacyl-[acyl-carrier protein] reductase [Kibdelosporangium aridum]
MTTLGTMRDKVVVVTGGSRGIGRAVVLAAAAAGAQVAFCARKLGPATDEVITQVESLAGKDRGLAVAADVASESDVEDLFDAVVDRFDRVDVVVNNAGINRDALLVHTTTEAFDDVIATNLTGAFLICRRAVREFLVQGSGGRIVSISSLSQHGATSQAAYAASKGGLLGLTRTIAKEYGHKSIIANLVTVGYVETDLTQHFDEGLRRLLLEATPLRRNAKPEEIAAAVLFLASTRAGYINGEAVSATGGLAEVAM